jgi:hypothetical protein
MMTFIGIVEGAKGYIFMRSPNNIVFTAIQALFDETLFPKCPTMHCLGYTPVGLPPDDLQNEHNGPPDNENEDYGGGDYLRYHLSHINLWHHRALLLLVSNHQHLHRLQVVEDPLHCHIRMMMKALLGFPR